MVFGSVISSPRGNLSLQKALDLANLYLDNACKSTDPEIILVLCHDTEVSLSQAKRAGKHVEDKAMRQGIATVYIELGDLLDSHGHRDEAQTFYKKSEKWGGRTQGSGQPTHPSQPTGTVRSIKGALSTTAATPITHPSSSSNQRKQGRDIATVPKNLFPANVQPPAPDFKPPEPDARLDDTPQLACCLELLQADYEPADILDTAARSWLEVTQDEPDEKERLMTLATDVIRAFKRDEFKNAKAVTEVVYLAPVLENDDFRYLVKEFYSGIDQSGLLDVHQLEGLARLVQGARSGYLDADDLVKVLELLSTRLRGTHQQSTHHLYQLTMAVSHVLDAMADTEVNGLDREKIHEPLSSYLDGLKGSSDPYLVYQAAYAYQALLCVPDDEALWQTAFRRTGKVIKGVFGIVTAVKGLDLNKFIEGLMSIQQGVAGASEIFDMVKSTYDGVTSLAKSGQGFFESLKEGFSFSRKCSWYPALRGADTLIREGQFAEFRKLVCEVPCRRDAAFQWGVCERLGEIAANPKWDSEIRQSAIAFLGEIYRNDITWGHQPTVKQWILNILMQLSILPGGGMQSTGPLLQELQSNGDDKKQALYRVSRENGPGNHPLKVTLPPIGSLSLLDRVQERPDVEGHIRQLRRQRLKERGNAVYITPQAKANLQAGDETCYPLMEKVDEFLASEQRVFLLLGDSGAGKSTFNRELECHLWEAYKKSGAIPLHISLPIIDKPEHDMIAKQLRRAEFTELQIRELKFHRTFALICDGYDESQQTHNLYTSNRLNQLGEWNAKMVISCRSEYIGTDYRDRFQPGDRNHRSEPALFQEAVMTPFSVGQIQEYITQYVSVHRPLWEADEYKRALDLIPSLKELVKNPFLMSLSLEVLPRIVDPGQDLSATQITRVALYDQFIEHWLERGKKRLGEKKMGPLARAAFESLVDEGFTRNGIDYLKRLSVAIYKEQDGQPIVRYSRYNDEDSWKTRFFNREDEKQLLREACPLIRTGNQHRFVHRSLLEYGLALAVFDPHDWKERMAPESVLARRGSTSSVLSSDESDSKEKVPDIVEQEPDFNSPLAWRSFTRELSVLQFLEERVQQEPLFKQQLFDYIEHSKTDKKWRTAASNAITILVRSGVQFNSVDLRGIKIPRADLSNGVFDSAQLQEADLRNVYFHGCWLRRADLSKALVTGVQFGELPLLEQEDDIQSCVYSPNGNTVAISLDNGKIKVYSTTTWEILWTGEHTNNVVIVAYSPNGDQLASGSWDKTVCLWDTTTGANSHVLRGHGGGIACIAYSPQGDQLASGSDDKTVKLWDLETGDCLHTLAGHTKTVTSIAYSPKGDQIVSGSGDATVRLWSIQTSECLHVLREHFEWISMVVFSPQGDQVASASDDNTVRLWNVATGDRRYTLTGHNRSVQSIAYSPKGDRMVSSSNDKTVRLWDVDTGNCLHTLTGHANEVKKVVYSPQGDLIASCSEDKTLRLWDAESGVCLQTLTGHAGCVKSAVFSPKGDQIVSTSFDSTVRLWEVGAGTSQPTSNGHRGWVRMIQCSPKGDEFASCSDDMTVRLWDVETGACRHILRGHRMIVYCVVYSPQGDQLATSSKDSTVRLWNVETGSCSHTLTGHTMEINRVAYSPQGDQLASGSDDRTVRLWNVKSGECRHVLTGHVYNIRDVVYSPNGQQVASSSNDKTVRLWDVQTGECSFTLSGHSEWIWQFVYSPQGDQIATASYDKTARLWNVKTGECRHILTGHESELKTVAYSPDGGQVVSGSRDGSLRLWDTESGTCLQTLDGHNKPVNSTVFSPQGGLVVSACDDKSVRIWDAASGQCRAVIQDFQGYVQQAAWVETLAGSCIVTGSMDGLVGAWQVDVDGDQCHVRLRWRTVRGELDVKDTIMHDVQGLSQLNNQLLKQRGAVGDPANRLLEASKKVATMTSVVSNIKAVSERTEEPPLIGNVSAEQLEQRAEQAKDPLFRDIVAAIVKDIHGPK